MTIIGIDLKSRLKVETPKETGLFWRRASNLHYAWQNAEHEDMENMWYWKLIELMLNKYGKEKQKTISK